MASTLETMQGSTGIMMSRINQNQSITSCHNQLPHSRSIRLLLHTNKAPFDPVIRLTWDAAGQGEQAISRPVTVLLLQFCCHCCGVAFSITLSWCHHHGFVVTVTVSPSLLHHHGFIVASRCHCCSHIIAVVIVVIITVTVIIIITLLQSLSSHYRRCCHRIVVVVVVVVVVIVVVIVVITSSLLSLCHCCHNCSHSCCSHCCIVPVIAIALSLLSPLCHPCYCHPCHIISIVVVIVKRILSWQIHQTCLGQENYKDIMGFYILHSDLTAASRWR